MTIAILFVLGLIVGSFLNVVGLRWDLPAGRQALKHFGGRSKCPHCGITLRWYELVPVLSFVSQFGRCRNCGQKISFQYPLIELWTALVFITVPAIFIPVFCVYIVIVIYDIHHKIIPDPLVYVSIILALLISRAWFPGLVLFAFFSLIWLLSRGRAMGFGDAKLGLSMGLLLGAAQSFSAVALAFWIGAAFGIVCMIFSRKNITMKSEIPFAPFLVLGAWVSVMFNLDLLHVPLL